MKKRPKIVCPSCQELRAHRARGLCLQCYEKQYPRKPVICLGCGVLSEHKARNLCQTCYNKSYQDFPKLPWNLGRNAEAEIEKVDLLRRIPDTPTNAQPGTEEKIRVMAERHGTGQFLYHPDDNATPMEPPSSTHKPVSEFDITIHRSPPGAVDISGSMDF